MRNRLYLSVWALAIASLLLAPAGAVAAGQEQTAQQAEKGARSATGAVSDGWITMKVHAQFIGVDPLEDSDIDVDTNSGVVTLNGTVVTEAGRKRAIAIAKATDGVKNVIDNLRIGRAEAMGERPEAERETGTAGRAAGRPVTDGWVKSKIYGQFLADDALDDSDIDIDVAKGAVTLNGTVPSAASKTRAENIAKKTEGVKTVKNMLKVRS